jgi:hypothetical protein
MRADLAKNGIDFATLKQKPVTVYVIQLSRPEGSSFNFQSSRGPVAACPSKKGGHRQSFQASYRNASNLASSIQYRYSIPRALRIEK